MLSIIGRLYFFISPRRRLQFLSLIGLTLITSASEVISLGAVVPFVGILTSPSKIFSYPFASSIAYLFGVHDGSELIAPIALLFIFAAIFAAILRVLMLFFSIRLSNAISADLSVEMYRRTLYQPYSVHVSRSSGEIVSAITQKVNTATTALNSLVTVITSAILFISILATLLFIDPLVAGFSLGAFGGLYALIAYTTKRRLRNNSKIIADQQTHVIRSLQEGLGGIRDILLDGLQNAYSGFYRTSILSLQKATGENQFITLAPRYVMEALGMGLVGAFALYINSKSDDIQMALPIFAALALGAQRLLPILQQLYGNLTFIFGSRSSLEDVLGLLEQPMINSIDANVSRIEKLTGSIQIDRMSFRYGDGDSWILSDVSLFIPKGSFVGIVGATGSGKSTLLDLLMGLLTPSMGKILVGGISIGDVGSGVWQKLVAHVPQTIYLADSTIAENIAFGEAVANINMQKVLWAAQRAQLSDYIESQPEGYKSLVGERGVRLSGGQRQRIGIARALYKLTPFLVLDEATSALDGKTEHAILSTLESLKGNLTVIMVAHRLSTIKNCDLIVELENGRIKAQGSYGELVQISPSFNKLTQGFS
jgi:ATP-binding cassette subfamily B protein